MKRVSFVVMMALALAGAPSAFAQQAQGGGSTNVTQGQGSGSGQGSGQGQGRGGATTVSGQQGFGSSMTNVRLDLTITDQTTANAAPIKKVISMLLAERGSGRVRSNSMVEPSTPGTPAYHVMLNADANVSRIEGERIRIGVTVEYAPAAPDAAKVGSRGSPLNQTVDVVLTSGKPTVIVQSSDPLTDRKVTLEATATILR